MMTKSGLPFRWTDSSFIDQVYICDHGDIHQGRFPLPATAPPNLPSCLPRPDRLAAGAAGGGTVDGSFIGTGGPGMLRVSLDPPFISGPSPSLISPTPSGAPSSRPSPACLCVRRAFSCTLRNFSNRSPHLTMASSRPLSLLGLSKFAPADVDAVGRGVICR